MSTAPAEVTSSSDSTSEKPGSLPEPKPELVSPPRRWLWIALAVLAIVLATALYAMLRSRAPVGAKTAQSLPGNPEQVLRLKGTTEAVQSRSILVPQLAGEHFAAMTIIHLVPNGTKV